VVLCLTRRAKIEKKSCRERVEVDKTGGKKVLRNEKKRKEKKNRKKFNRKENCNKTEQKCEK